MAKAKQGDTVRVHYTGKLEDGKVFDTTQGRDPLQFTTGEGKVIPGFEAALVGMGEGEKKTVTLPPEKAYGPRRQKMVGEIGRAQLPEDFDPKVGQVIRLRHPNGQELSAVIIEIKKDVLVIDGNNPLAGKTLIFEVELLKIG